METHAAMSVDAYAHVKKAGVPGAPTVFAFHGTGGNEHQLVPLATDLVPGATVVSPRGDVLEHGAARFFRRTAEGVYDMADLARATDKMASFVKAHVAEAGGGPVLGIGYSNGANILAAVIFRHPGLFSGAVLMHPLIPFAPQVHGTLGGLRVLITAGRRDPICPPDLTERLDAWLRSAGAEVDIEWHEGGHDLRPNEVEAARRFLSAGAA